MSELCGDSCCDAGVMSQLRCRTGPLTSAAGYCGLNDGGLLCQEASRSDALRHGFVPGTLGNVAMKGETPFCRCNNMLFASVCLLRKWLERYDLRNLPKCHQMSQDAKRPSWRLLIRFL